MNLDLGSNLTLWILTYLQLTKVITSLMEVAFGLQKPVVNDDYFNTQQKQKILGTTAVRNLKQFELTCELKRMYVLRDFRRLGVGQKLLDIAINFAKSVVYPRIVLDSSKALHAARALYLKNGFVGLSRNHRIL